MRKRLLISTLGIVIATLTLAGCAGSANATACKLYEDGYNQMSDAVALQDADLARAQLAALSDRFQDAYDRATGDVAVAMRASVESAQLSIDAPDSEDAGVAMFMDITSVQEACAADGAQIDLHNME